MSDPARSNIHRSERGGLERRDGESMYMFSVRERAHLKAEVKRLEKENAKLNAQVAELSNRCIESIGG